MFATHLLLAAFSGLAVVACDSHGYTVATKYRTITGHAAPNVSGVVEFLGIPYAEPPLGALRFQPPVPYKNKHAFDATNWVCMQLL